MPDPSNLYEEVVRVTYVFLGPAADRFVSRQIVNHLEKQPEELRYTELPELISWIRLAMGFLTEDVSMIDDYVSRLESLVGAGGHPNGGKKAAAHVHRTR